MSKPDDFVHLHTHSDFSPLDGCGKVDDFIETAMERGHRAIAFTEHGNMRGIHSLAKHTQDKDIKPIYGIEFYVMLYVDGVSLRERIVREKQLYDDEVVRIAAEVAEGLARAHDKGIVHRDLKPANIMVTEDGHAKIID